MNLLLKNLLILCCLMFCVIFNAYAKADAAISDAELIKPKSIVVDQSLGQLQAEKMLRAARLFYTFWDTGEKKYIDVLVDPNFIDNTLPAGRPQGVKGLLFASNNFRKAVPDLHCSVEDLLITGDKVTARLLLTGTFTGEFNGIKGNHKPVKFIAIDILRIKDGKLMEDWHLEDNLTLLQQLNAVKML